jgi:PAS domain S-box-containing protein
MWGVNRRMRDAVVRFLRRADEESIRGDVIGALFLLGALLTVGALALPHPNGTDLVASWGVAVSATLTGAVLIARSAEMTTPQLHLAVAFGSVLINLLVLASGVASGVFTAMFPWVVLVAVNFFTWRAAIAHYAWLMVGYGVALGLTESASGFSPVTRWMAAAFGLAVTGGATAWLVYRRRIAEDQRRRFLDLSEEMLCAIDGNNRFLQVNPTWGSRLGYTDAQLLAEPFTSLIHPLDREATRAAISALRDGGEASTLENRIQRSDGTWQRLIWRASFAADEELVYARVQPVRESDGAPQMTRSPARQAVPAE